MYQAPKENPDNIILVASTLSETPNPLITRLAAIRTTAAKYLQQDSFCTSTLALFGTLAVDDALDFRGFLSTAPRFLVAPVFAMAGHYSCTSWLLESVQYYGTKLSVKFILY